MGLNYLLQIFMKLKLFKVGGSSWQNHAISLMDKETTYC